MNKNSRWRGMISGILIGCFLTFVILGAAAGVGADSRQLISAWLSPDVTFQFDGEAKPLPEGYTVLIYQDRTYVPARFMAETLGAEVDWDEATRTVLVTSKEEEPPDEEPPVNDEDLQPPGNYRYLPITRVYRDFDITTTLVNIRDRYTRVHISLENREVPPQQIVQRETRAIVDGKEYRLVDAPVFEWDTTWFNDVQRNQTVEGYLVLPRIPVDAEKMRLFVTVLQNDRTQQTRVVEFDIALEVIDDEKD